MKNAVLISICFIAGLAGANVQPILSGAGKLIFPENATPANISASGGALTIAAGGANQNITLTPSGAGITTTSTGATIGGFTQINSAASIVARLKNGSASNNNQLRWFGNNAAADLWALGTDLTGTNAKDLSFFDLTNQPLFLQWGTNRVGCGGNVAPGFSLDCTGDINASGVFRSGTTAGQTVTRTMCKTGACATTCTIIFTGGIATGGTC